MQISSMGPNSRANHSPQSQPQDKPSLKSGVDASRSNSQSAKAPDPQANRQSALKLVEQTLAMGYEKLAARQNSAVEEFKAFEPLTAEKVAGNILGFIEQRLMKDAAEGATEEELKQRLEQGLAGFEKGFAQAREQLEALSMLSPEIGEDIENTRTLVLDGIDQLRLRLLDDRLERPVED
jgi:hypothetical protein